MIDKFTSVFHKLFFYPETFCMFSSVDITYYVYTSAKLVATQDKIAWRKKLVSVKPAIDQGRQRRKKSVCFSCVSIMIRNFDAI